MELEQKRFYQLMLAESLTVPHQHFTKYVDYGFTANLEDELDAVSVVKKNGYLC